MGREREREGHCDIKKGTWPFKNTAPLTRPDQQCNWITKVQVCVCVCVCVRACMLACVRASVNVHLHFRGQVFCTLVIEKCQKQSDV